jgi:hypothetical protein
MIRFWIANDKQQFLIDAFTIFTLERNGIQFIWMMNIYEKR